MLWLSDKFLGFLFIFFFSLKKNIQLASHIEEVGCTATSEALHMIKLVPWEGGGPYFHGFWVKETNVIRLIASTSFLENGHLIC